MALSAYAVRQLLQQQSRGDARPSIQYDPF
jgi:hypothetical protein